MRNLSVARRYARALIDVATEGGSPGSSVDKVADQLDVFAKLMNENVDLRDALLNPAFTRAQRGEIINGLVKATDTKLDVAVASLFNLLLDRNRFSFLPDIARLYRDMADAKSGRVRGHITTAVPLGNDAVKQIEQALEKSLQRNVVLETRVDPRLLGGVSAQVGSMLFDGSLKSQLEELRRSLKSH